MNIDKMIKLLEKQIINPKLGLPEDVFLFISRLTPMVNVDLLIKDENERTLLSWRKDKHYEPGWHIPGGVVRFKEKLEKRIQKVAESEIGAIVKFKPTPLAINQIILRQKTRGHAISILYKCFLSSKFFLKNKDLSINDNGYLKWFKACPKNLIKVHGIYKGYI